MVDQFRRIQTKTTSPSWNSLWTIMKKSKKQTSPFPSSSKENHDKKIYEAGDSEVDRKTCPFLPKNYVSRRWEKELKVLKTSSDVPLRKIPITDFSIVNPYPVFDRLLHLKILHLYIQWSMVGHMVRVHVAEPFRYVKRIRQLMHERKHRILSLTRQSFKEHPSHLPRMIPITFQKHISSLLGLRLKTCTSIFIFQIPSHNYSSLIPKTSLLKSH